MQSPARAAVRTPLLILSLAIFAGCGAAPSAPQEPASPAPPAPSASASAPPEATEGIDHVACVGAVASPPAGLAAVDDAALLPKALDATGKGKLCTGKVFKATARVAVYRVWNKEKGYTQLGGWWSFAPPAGPVDGYRKDNAICPEWSQLNVVSKCFIKVGSEVVVGPGQSADCEHDVKYPKSATNQVYIANDTRVEPPVVLVEDCTEGAPWP
jgi:hypothetical protein